MNCVPRPSPKYLGNRTKIRTPWNFTLSVFKPYIPDNEGLLLRCFELDWSRTKIERLIKDPEQLDKVKNLCRHNYKWFRESYKFITAVDPQKDLLCISTIVFGDTVMQMDGMVDGKTLKLSDLDLEFIATKAQNIQGKQNPERALVRHNWMEIFVRLCQTKYVKNGAGGPNVKNWQDCFSMMLQ
jgi:hypothetical protein